MNRKMLLNPLLKAFKSNLEGRARVPALPGMEEIELAFLSQNMGLCQGQAQLSSFDLYVIRGIHQ